MFLDFSTWSMVLAKQALGAGFWRSEGSVDTTEVEAMYCSIGRNSGGTLEAFAAVGGAGGLLSPGTLIVAEPHPMEQRQQESLKNDRGRLDSMFGCQ